MCDLNKTGYSINTLYITQTDKRREKSVPIKQDQVLLISKPKLLPINFKYLMNAISLF